MTATTSKIRFAYIGFLAISWSWVSRASQPDSAHSLLETFSTSVLFNNLTDDGRTALLRHLSHVARAPADTRLRRVHELQYGDSGHEICSILDAFPKLSSSTIPLWGNKVSAFLNSYTHRSWPVLHGPREVVLNLTALSGLPMIRRSLLAQIATAWLTTLNRDFDSLAPTLGHLVRKLYAIHCASVTQRGVMEYFHISKAGGTSWNSAAKLNGCVRSNFIGSHVRGFGDECRWMNQTVYKELTGGRRILWGRWGRVARDTRFRTCEQRYDEVAARGFAYTSNEYTLMGGMEDMRAAHLCPHLVNVVTLRNPIKRMESNIRFIMMHIKGAYRRGVAGGEKAFQKFFCNATATLWDALGPPITDNYIVRSFLGEKGFHTPPGSIGPPHVAVARDQLLQFDLVLDLDAGGQAGDRMAQQALGWPTALSRAHALDSAVLSVRMDLNYTTCHPRDDDMEALKRRQAPDMELYGFGRVVSQLDALWLDLARALGLKPLEGRDLPPDAPPEAIKCGLLWRGANTSALVDALHGGSAEDPAPEDDYDEAGDGGDDDDEEEGEFSAGTAASGGTGTPVGAGGPATVSAAVPSPVPSGGEAHPERPAEGQQQQPEQQQQQQPEQGQKGKEGATLEADEDVIDDEGMGGVEV